MPNEFEHIKDLPGALVWAVGCILASHKTWLAELHNRHPGKMLRGIAACGLVVLLVGYAIEGQASGHALAQPAFTDAACDLPHISPDIRPRLRCGTVSVPRDYQHPEAGRFKLAIVIIRSEQQPASSDPLVYISGGPGSPLIVYANDQARHPFARGRDLILVDQRGMGRSEPSICPDHNRGLANALAMAVIEPTADRQARRHAAFMACRDDEIASGIELRDFGTAVTVQDFDAVRQALGVKQWNVFGVSYGTTVTMTLMARYPETIRSAVLDSVYPPDPIPPLWSSNVVDARNAFFTTCDRDAACAAAYPDLADIYRETMRQLDHSPPALMLPPGLRDPSHPGRLTAALFEFVVGHLVYYPNFYPNLPRLIASVHDGDTTLFALTLASLFAEMSNPDTGTNLAAGAAVECRDRPRFRQKLSDDADILDRTSLYDVCKDWADLGVLPVIPVGTRVPTLILAGQFDPNARPDLSRHVADLIGSHARWVEFQLAGHSVRASSPCASRIVAEFVDHPAQAPETTCAGEPPPIRFLPMHRAP
jgi:pimeloyl-ACP methyl ester carboxylesterase